ncbi:MAG: twin-arginine translocase TatA/TatE family subunit, partial [Acidobacteria bacterium]|nr:twin-arginine translocase TatA/TatE family subunit [Acidobacteriota bacterium]
MVALIVFGPRKLPQMARKAGSFLRELRGVSDEFKSTWAQEVRLNEEPDTGTFFDKIGSPNKILGKEENTLTIESVKEPANISADEASGSKSILPEVRQVSGEDFKRLMAEKDQTVDSD